MTDARDIAIRELTRQCEELEMQRDRLVDAARWVLHVVNGVGRAGGPPRSEEHEASLGALREAVERVAPP